MNRRSRNRQRQNPSPNISEMRDDGAASSCYCRAGGVLSPSPARWANDDEMIELHRISSRRIDADRLRAMRATAMTTLADLRNDLLAFVGLAEKIETLDAEIERIGQ